MDFSMLLGYKNKSEEELEKYVNNESFKWACENGHLEVAQWLLSIKPDIDVSAVSDWAFRWTCENGHLEVAQWLLSIKPDIDVSAVSDWAFKGACQEGHLDVSQWLCTLDNRYQKIPVIQ